MATIDQISVRVAVKDDAAVLTDFNCGIARETEDKELDRELVLAGVQRGMQQGKEARYYVATHEGDAVGCLLLTREWSDWRNGWIVWIQSVYVQEEYRGIGVFRKLLDHATEVCKSEPDTLGLRLYVEVENERAQDVYRKTGFTDPKYKVLEKLW